MKKHIIRTHDAVFEPIADLDTWRAMPTHSIESLDPFLFLNHHGPQEYGPNNRGLPFGPHPHRGFETLTFVLQGDIAHRDSSTGESVITAGGIQWMTAGSGLVHAEVSSDKFKKEGGMEEVIQLWLNLPSHLKMVAPNYIGLQKEEIPSVKFDEGRGELALVSGKFQDKQGPINSLTGLFTSTIQLKKGGKLEDKLPDGSQVLLYVVKGAIQIGDQKAATHQLAELSMEENEFVFEALEDSQLVYCHGLPFNEPIVAHGPFVMNTREEISQAIRDYQSGKMGSLD